MSALDVIRRVEACGGRLTVENGALKLRAPAALPEDVMQAVSAEKPAIMITLGAPLDVTVANILDDIRPHLSPALRCLPDSKLLALVNWHIIAAWNAALREVGA